MSTKIDRPQTVLISGAAGGLGSAVARRFAADGARVALSDINAAQVAELANELGGIALPADGTDRGAVREVVEDAASAFGGLEAVIGVQGAQVKSTTNPSSNDGWDKSLAVNLNGQFYFAAEAIPHLLKSQGSIVLVSSSAGILSGPPGALGYTAAKHGVVGLARWLAREYGPRGIRTNCITPGWIRTPLGDGGMEYIAERDGITLDEAYERTTALVPMRRAAHPGEIASVCAFLVSSDASMVNGHVLVADGGAAVVDSSTAFFN
ncbi:SDR family NAD(P)-dependent oxidoreductase [Sinomonas humi]|uniref:3-oxoacyl-ACP reductase n=1 Tax=Sinomonas humi TaxID=1338436 RepID=A0A0B2AGZ5_9MICC|nr:SDR family oxidoreductase [Sinomonas humi]KHL02475.1 hypothetical protein LK10_12865 [Sinomonas humi]